MSLKEEIKDIRSSKRDLHKFCLIIAIVIIGWGFIFFFKSSRYYVYFFLIALLLLIAGMFFPILIKPLYKVAAVFTVFWRWLFAKLFLWLIFFLVFAPINYIARVFGKRFLELKTDEKIDSYWMPKKEIRSREDSYERQF